MSAYFMITAGLLLVPTWMLLTSALRKNIPALQPVFLLKRNSRRSRR